MHQRYYIIFVDGTRKPTGAFQATSPDKATTAMRVDLERELLTRITRSSDMHTLERLTFADGREVPADGFRWAKVILPLRRGLRIVRFCDLVKLGQWVAGDGRVSPPVTMSCAQSLARVWGGRAVQIPAWNPSGWQLEQPTVASLEEWDRRLPPLASLSHPGGHLSGPRAKRGEP